MKRIMTKYFYWEIYIFLAITLYTSDTNDLKHDRILKELKLWAIILTYKIYKATWIKKMAMPHCHSQSETVPTWTVLNKYRYQKTLAN